jgi:hypothetical protein
MTWAVPSATSSSYCLCFDCLEIQRLIKSSGVEEHASAIEIRDEETRWAKGGKKGEKEVITDHDGREHQWKIFHSDEENFKYNANIKLNRDTKDVVFSLADKMHYLKPFEAQPQNSLPWRMEELYAEMQRFRIICISILHHRDFPVVLRGGGPVKAKASIAR